MFQKWSIGLPGGSRTSFWRVLKTDLNMEGSGHRFYHNFGTVLGAAGGPKMWFLYRARQVQPFRNFKGSENGRYSNVKDEGDLKLSLTVKSTAW